MPKIKDLERFRRDLVALAKESEVLAQWGEVREDPALPSEEAQAAPPPPRKGPTPPRKPGAAPDFASLLSGLPLADKTPTPASDSELDDLLALPEEESGLPEAAGQGLPEEETAGETDGDFAQFLASLDSGAEAESPTSEAEPSFEEDLGEAEEKEGPLPAAEEESTFDLGAFAGSLEELDRIETSPPPAEPSAPTEPTPPESPIPDEFDFSLPAEDVSSPPASAGDFDLPSFEEPEAASAGFDLEEGLAPAEVESPPEGTAEPSSFDLSDFGAEEGGTAPAALEGGASDFDFDLPGEGPASLEGDFGALGAGGLEDLGEATATEPEPGLGEESELPDLGGEDFSIPGFEPEARPAKAPASEPPAPEGFPLGAEEAPLDAFDAYTFDEPAGGLSGEALDRELENLGGETDLASTFSLEGSFDNFGAPEQDEGPRRAETPGPASGRRGAGRREEEPGRKVSLTEAQVDRLQDRLLALPLNLRVAVEDSIANERGSEAQRSDLVWMLVESASLEELASAAGKILKRRISIPEGYVRRTGAGYLEEKGSLGYLLAHTVLPIARMAFLVLLVASALGYLGWRFIYKPIVATSLYRTGYQRIAEGRYPEAEDAFVRATSIREFVVWYYRYAEAYVQKRQYIRAEDKYRSLLEGDRKRGIVPHPLEKKAALAWARLEQDQLKYKDAVDILNKHVIDHLPRDEDALLLQGDIFLEWGDEDRARYEDARKRFARLIEYHGTKDLYLERMLLLFMRTDILKEVLPLKQRFLAAKKPRLAASTLAELGGYLLDHDRVPEVLPVLKLALDLDRLLPETNFQLHRYYQKAGEPGEEMKGLDNAIAGFERLSALGKRRLGMYLDSLVRRGDLRLAAGGFLTAEEDYGKGAVAYERARDLDRVPRTPAWAKAWAGLGDVAYWGRDDLTAAEDLYAKAEQQGWDEPAIRYRRGFIASRDARYADALEHFWRAMQGGIETPPLLYAIGNTFFERGDYHAAEGYYRRIIEKLGDRFDALDYPEPQDKPSDRALVETLMEAQNNRGVALYRLGGRIGNAKLKAEAIAAFDASARLYDTMVRDTRSLISANAANLGYLNMDYVLHPKRGIDLAIYRPIAKDPDWSYDTRYAQGGGVGAAPAAPLPAPAAEKP